MLLVTQYYVMLFHVFKNVRVNNIFQHFAANAHKTELSRHAYDQLFILLPCTLSHYIGFAEKARSVKAGNHLAGQATNNRNIAFKL